MHMRSFPFPSSSTAGAAIAPVWNLVLPPRSRERETACAPSIPLKKAPGGGETRRCGSIAPARSESRLYGRRRLPGGAEAKGSHAKCVRSQPAAQVAVGRRAPGATRVVICNKLALPRIWLPFTARGGGLLPGRQARALHFRERFLGVLATVLKRELGGFEPGHFWLPHKQKK